MAAWQTKTSPRYGERFNATISRIDELAPRLLGMVDRLEVIVDRVERIVGLGEAVVAPISATEQRDNVRP